MRSFIAGLIFGAGLTAAILLGYVDPLIAMAREQLGLASSEESVADTKKVQTAKEIPQKNGGSVQRASVSGNGHLAEAFVCLGQNVSNSPVIDADGRITSFSSHVVVSGVTLAAAPVSKGCLSSGYGQRDGKLHKGVDYHSKTGAVIYAAGSGTVLEALYRDDYGNMVLIDHGNGVYVRYAHLGSLAVVTGQEVVAGQNLGPMGKSAGYKIPLHLHMELLLGNYANPAASFGLSSKDILSYPAAS